MSAGQKDLSNSAVLLMMGVAVGIPISIVVGLVIDQTGYALLAGPPAGLLLGFVMAAMAGKDSDGQPSNP